MQEDKNKKENPHKGHRDRVKKKFLANGFTDATPDHEMLEMLLFYSVPQKDTNELAHDLLNHFGGFSGVLEARAEELMQVKGISEHSAALIKLLLPLNHRYIDRKRGEKIKLTSLESFAEYIQELYVGETNEVVRVFMFNNKNELLGKEILSRGDLVSAEINPRKVVEIVLKYDATAMILAHNHPQGFAVASKDDLRATSRIKAILRDVNVHFYDHVIVADNKHLSMRGLKEYEPFFS